MLVFALCADTVFKPFIKQLALKQLGNSAQRALLKKEEKAADYLNYIRDQFIENKPVDEQELYRKSYCNDVYIYIYKENVLTFWTDNAIFPEQFSAGQRAYVQKLGNGVYLQRNTSAGNYQFVALIPIQHNYIIENQYLNNSFTLLDGRENIQLHFSKDEETVPLYNKNGNYLFSISNNGKYAVWWISALFVIGLGIIIGCLHLLGLKLVREGKRNAACILFITNILLLVIPWKILRIPSSLMETKIFSPEYYGSSELLSSLGDLVLLTLAASYSVWLLLKVDFFRDKHSVQSRTGAAILCFLVFMLAAYTEHIIRSLVLDSQISFDLSNIFSLSFYSFIGLLCVFGWLVAFLAVTKRFSQWLADVSTSNKSIFLILLICFAATLGFLRFMNLPYFAAAALAYSSILVLYIHFRNDAGKRYMRGVIYLVLSTLFLSACLIFYTQRKQIDAQRLLATRLATERDAIAEYLFNGIYQKIRKDPYIKSYYVNPVISSNFLQKRIKQLYFSGYLNKYDVLVSSYTREGVPFKIDYEKPLAFYQNILERGATPVKDKSLYFLHTYRGLPGYMATIPIVKDGYVLGTILLQFQQKAFYEESVYPELLLTSNIQHYNELSNYSYAIFNKNTLFTQKGTYPYPSVSLFPPKPDSAGFARFNRNGYTHLVHFITKDLRVVVSQPQQSAIFFFSIFTSVFLFLGVCWLLVLLLPKFGRFIWLQSLRRKPVSYYFQRLWAGLSFRYKILSTITGGISLALVLVGFATVAYIVYQYDKDEIKKLQRRTKIITARLENDLQSNEQASTMGEDELDAMVKNLSDMYRTDINLFDAYGNLLSSTQSGIYEQNIIARKMNARAYLKFHNEFASLVTQEESIGKLNYTAAYMPLRNIFGDIIGYINIPYFSKEKDLTDRISNFLIALLNLYLLIFLILVGLSLFMARALTTPLDIIRNHLRNTSLGGSPIFLQWHTKDEIGKLVNEYNTMLIELQTSANKLAQSEREGAWREMAKQVAHEIKNPLTPMKLNIQRLQMAYHEGKEDIKPLFDKVTALLIRQIDSLSEIATAFSSFAQMPQGTPQTVDANQLMREVSQLFSQQNDANINLNLLEKPALVKVDPNQLSRVLTNLVKNAVQAFQDGRRGEVCLQTSESNSHILLKVHDNGSGIPEELQKNIFVPSFSTKTSGMGLGLAISKKIINNAGGDIYFHTEQDKGTTFTIELPKINEQ